MISWIQDMGGWFTADQYLFWTRLQGTAWTLADMVIVLYLTRSANVLRSVLAIRPHVVPYVVLAATVPIAVFLPVAPDGMAFFRLEIAVTVPHFLLILYLMGTNASVVGQALPQLLASGAPRNLSKDTQAS